VKKTAADKKKKLRKRNKKAVGNAEILLLDHELDLTSYYLID